MKKIGHKNLQRQVSNLIPMVKLYVNSIADLEQIHTKINLLPADLKNLQQQADLLEQKSDHKSTDDIEAHVQQTEFQLDSLIDDLDRVSADVVTFEHKLKNIIALKERLEAMQEERINGLTPERIYRLLAKQQQHELEENNSTSKRQNMSQIIGQKLIGLGSTLSDRKVIISLTMVVSLFLGWGAGYHSSINARADGDTTETIEKESDNSEVEEL